MTDLSGRELYQNLSVFYKLLVYLKLLYLLKNSFDILIIIKEFIFYTTTIQYFYYSTTICLSKLLFQNRILISTFHLLGKTC